MVTHLRGIGENKVIVFSALINIKIIYLATHRFLNQRNASLSGQLLIFSQALKTSFIGAVLEMVITRTNGDCTKGEEDAKTW